MIDEYGFNMELVVQSKTLSMHGSTKGHTGYIYRQNNDVELSKAVACKTKTYGVLCNRLFAKSWEMCRGSLYTLSEYTYNEVEKHWRVMRKRVTRADAKKRSVAD